MPPIVKKQSPGGPPPTNGVGGGVLSRIGTLSEHKLRSARLALYGLPKSGKTRLACSFPKPLLLIGFEDGTASVQGIKGIDFVLLRETSELHELYEGPIKAGKYASVVLDNGTKMRDMRIVELFASKGLSGADVPEKKPFMFASALWREVWVQCSKDMKDLLFPLYDMPLRSNLCTVTIAQEQNFSPEGGEGGGGGGEMLKPNFGSAVGKTVSEFIHASVDHVGHTFVRQKVKEIVQTANGQQVTISQPTKEVEYCLQITPDDYYQAGFRVSHDKPLPPVLVNATYDKLVKMIRGEY